MNRLLTVVTTFLFAQRYDKMRIDKAQEHNPPGWEPPAPKPFFPGTIWDEYIRISKLGARTPKQPKATQVSTPAETGPQDVPPWIAPAEDLELDDMRLQDPLPPPEGEEHAAEN